MNLHKMIEICLKDDNMHIFVMINALICINNYVITCINSMLSKCHMRLSLSMYHVTCMPCQFCDTDQIFNVFLFEINPKNHDNFYKN